jgi:hypothetical protein
MSSLSVKIPGVSVVMGGITRVVPPLNLKALSLLQDRLSTFVGGVDKESVELILDAAEAALKRNYTEITRDQIEEELDVGNMTDVFNAIMDVSGLRRKAQELEGATAVGETGATSP